MSTKALQTRVEELEKLVVSLTEKMSTMEVKPADEKVVKKETTKGLKKDGTPRKKRAPCGYMVYSNEHRSEVREQLLAAADGEKVPPGAVVKQLASMWNDLPDEEKAGYNTRAKESAEVDIE